MATSIDLIAAPTGIQQGGYINKAYRDRTQALTPRAKLGVENTAASFRIMLTWECAEPVKSAADNTNAFVDSAALLVPGVIEFGGLRLPFEHSYGIQVITFFVCALLFRWAPIKRFLIPKRIRHQRAHRLAQEQFFQQNLHHTNERTGLLLFVSIAEHYVEIIADKGINDVVHAGVWDEVVTDFIEQVKAVLIAQLVPARIVGIM